MENIVKLKIFWPSQWREMERHCEKRL